MGEFTTIMARDGHEFQAWLAAPPGRPRGALLVIQEIFGVNRHIRKVTDGFAADGYTAIAPCLFDRVRRGIELGYTARRHAGRRGLREAAEAGADAARPRRGARGGEALRPRAARSATAGAACWRTSPPAELPVACAVVYYGRVAAYLDEKPKCPVMYHFGGRGPEHSGRRRRPRSGRRIPQAPLYVYEGAGHGFNCEQRDSYNPQAAALARTRTLEFFARYSRAPDAEPDSADANANT